MEGKRRGRRGCGKPGKAGGRRGGEDMFNFPKCQGTIYLQTNTTSHFRGSNQRPLRMIFVDLNAINVAVIRPRLGKYSFGVLLL
jgi:hypothetical protein